MPWVCGCAPGWLGKDGLYNVPSIGAGTRECYHPCWTRLWSNMIPYLCLTLAWKAIIWCLVVGLDMAVFATEVHNVLLGLLVSLAHGAGRGWPRVGWTALAFVVCLSCFWPGCCISLEDRATFMDTLSPRKCPTGWFHSSEFGAFGYLV